ncbi:hypothetical protein L596_027409 [Steinernema carpocapsae]|uniref:UPAR/Ly6 domain-containing protein n=1 Tax=Steinernema carpocapsae TaxID=34508 RepID=A0A4U5M493_STECR|nr:hypothetical protein L596_027409 [Steinernema carpocapsae]
MPVADRFIFKFTQRRERSTPTMRVRIFVAVLLAAFSATSAIECFSGKTENGNEATSKLERSDCSGKLDSTEFCFRETTDRYGVKRIVYGCASPKLCTKVGETGNNGQMGYAKTFCCNHDLCNLESQVLEAPNKPESPSSNAAERLFSSFNAAVVLVLAAQALETYVLMS